MEELDSIEKPIIAINIKATMKNLKKKSVNSI